MASEKTVEISVDDLPLRCPPPGAPLWSQHPRVFLDIAHDGQAVCPYCSTRYLLKGPLPKGQH